MSRKTRHLLTLSVLVLALPARAHALDAGAYRVAYIRPGAGGYVHGWNVLTRVGGNVLVGSPSEFSAADVYAGRTGERRFHFVSALPFDDASSFGSGVAASVRGFLVGEPRSGEVHLFGRRDGRPRVTLRAPPEPAATGFGTGIAELGGKIVVGAPYGHAASPYEHGPGAAFLFDGRTGALVRELVNPDPRLEGRFGQTVARCSGGFAVGQPGDYYAPGTVYVYDRHGVLRQMLRAPVPVPNDGFGVALAAHGKRLLVGRPRPFTTPGAAYLYERRGGRYVLVRTLTAPLESTAGFGRSVALAHHRAVVGAFEYVAVLDPDSGTALAALAPPVFYDPDMSQDYVPYLPWSGFGVSVAIVGRTIVVSTMGDDENAGSIVVGFAPHAPTPPECRTTYPCP